MHFPLLKGTEVVLSCVNGDIDRPIIVGAVPNPLIVGQRRGGAMASFDSARRRRSRADVKRIGADDDPGGRCRR